MDQSGGPTAVRLPVQIDRATPLAWLQTFRWFPPENPWQCFNHQHIKCKNPPPLIMKHVFLASLCSKAICIFIIITAIISAGFSFIMYSNPEYRIIVFFVPEHRFYPTDPVSVPISFPPAIVFAVAPTNEPTCMCCNGYVTALRKRPCFI